MVTRRDYTAEKVKAARSVLIELIRLLGVYRDDIVLIGGWGRRVTSHVNKGSIKKIQNPEVRIQEPEEMWSAEYPFPH